MRYRLRAGLLLAAILSTAPAAAQLSVEEAREAQMLRQSVFELLSWNMEPLASMARGTRPFDEEKAIAHSRRIAALAPMIPELFEADTRNTGVYNRAKDIVWDNWDTFQDRARDLELAARQMMVVAEGGDARALNGHIRTLGGSCGACHDLFRFMESDPSFPFRDSARR